MASSKSNNNTPNEVGVFWDYQNCLMQSSGQLVNAIDYVRKYCVDNGICNNDAIIHWHVVYLDELRKNNAPYSIPEKLLNKLNTFDKVTRSAVLASKSRNILGNIDFINGSFFENVKGIETDPVGTECDDTNKNYSNKQNIASILKDNILSFKFLQHKKITFTVKGAEGNKMSVDDRDLRVMFSKYMLNRPKNKPTGCVMITGDSDFFFDVIPHKETLGDNLKLGWICRLGAPKKNRAEAKELCGRPVGNWIYDVEGINSNCVSNPTIEFENNITNDPDDSTDNSSNHKRICKFYAEGRCRWGGRCENIHLDPEYARKMKIVDTRDKSNVIAETSKPVCWHYIRDTCSFGENCSKLHLDPQTKIGSDKIRDVRQVPINYTRCIPSNVSDTSSSDNESSYCQQIMDDTVEKLVHKIDDINNCDTNEIDHIIKRVSSAVKHGLLDNVDRRAAAVISGVIQASGYPYYKNDPAKSMNFFCASANSGFGPAYTALAVCCLFGINIETDYNEAKRLLLIADELGCYAASTIYTFTDCYIDNTDNAHCVLPEIWNLIINSCHNKTRSGFDIDMSLDFDNSNQLNSMYAELVTLVKKYEKFLRNSKMFLSSKFDDTKYSSIQSKLMCLKACSNNLKSLVYKTFNNPHTNKQQLKLLSKESEKIYGFSRFYAISDIVSNTIKNFNRVGFLTASQDGSSNIIPYLIADIYGNNIESKILVVNPLNNVAEYRNKTNKVSDNVKVTFSTPAEAVCILANEKFDAIYIDGFNIEANEGYSVLLDIIDRFDKVVICSSDSDSMDIVKQKIPDLQYLNMYNPIKEKVCSDISKYFHNDEDVTYILPTVDDVVINATPIPHDQAIVLHEELSAEQLDYELKKVNGNLENKCNMIYLTTQTFINSFPVHQQSKSSTILKNPRCNNVTKNTIQRERVCILRLMAGLECDYNDEGINNLREIGAFSQDNKLTDVGRVMCNTCLPVEYADALVVEYKGCQEKGDQQNCQLVAKLIVSLLLDAPDRLNEWLTRQNDSNIPQRFYSDNGSAVAFINLLLQSEMIKNSKLPKHLLESVMTKYNQLNRRLEKYCNINIPKNTLQYSMPGQTSLLTNAECEMINYHTNKLKTQSKCNYIQSGSIDADAKENQNDSCELEHYIYIDLELTDDICRKITVDFVEEDDMKCFYNKLSNLESLKCTRVETVTNYDRRLKHGIVIHNVPISINTDAIVSKASQSVDNDIDYKFNVNKEVIGNNDDNVAISNTRVDRIYTILEWLRGKFENSEFKLESFSNPYNLTECEFYEIKTSDKETAEKASMLLREENILLPKDKTCKRFYHELHTISITAANIILPSKAWNKLKGVGKSLDKWRGKCGIDWKQGPLNPKGNPSQQPRKIVITSCNSDDVKCIMNAFSSYFIGKPCGHNPNLLTDKGIQYMNSISQDASLSVYVHFNQADNSVRIYGDPCDLTIIIHKLEHF